MFSRFVFLLLFIAAFCYAASFTTTHGKLKVSGSKILDKNNNEVVLRGMSFYWYNGPWGGGQPGNQFYTSANVSSLADSWNANVVRAAIGNVTQSSSDALAMAKNMMDWANSAGIYVIIDNHSHIAHRPNQVNGVKSFFSDVSAYVKSKGYTHVIYEIYNEPLCDTDQENNISYNCSPRTTWAQIKSFSEGVISTIRNNDPDGLIIVGTPFYSSDIGSARGNPLTGNSAHNALYALHFYAGTSGHGTYRYALEGAYCNDFPVFVSEWGTSEASGGGTISTSNSDTWMNLLEGAKVSHANWSLSNTSESSAALTSTSLSGSLTASGNYVKNLFRLNTGASYSDVGLSPKSISCSGSGQPVGPNGRIGLSSNGSFANFDSKSGADSITTKYGAALSNTSANFTADYFLTSIEATGTYLIEFYYASSATGTVSWSGPGVSSGQAQFENTGLDNFKYTEPQLISVNEMPETPLKISVQMPSANSLKAVWIYTHEASEEDSLKYNITPIRTKAVNASHWSYDAASGVFAFEASEGSLAIYNLRGERKAFFAVSGQVSLKSILPSGTYLAVYKQGAQAQRRTIYLK